jgi:hypothetical protein
MPNLSFQAIFIILCCLMAAGITAMLVLNQRKLDARLAERLAATQVTQGSASPGPASGAPPEKPADIKKQMADYYLLLMAELPPETSPTMKILIDLMEKEKLPPYVVVEDAGPKSARLAPLIDRETFDLVPAYLPNVDPRKTCRGGPKGVSRLLLGRDNKPDEYQCSSGNNFWVTLGGDDVIEHSNGLKIVNPGTGNDKMELHHGTKVIVLEKGWGKDTLNGECTRENTKEKELTFKGVPATWPLKFKSSIVFGPGVAPADLYWAGHQLTHRNGQDMLTFNDSVCYNFIFSEPGVLQEPPPVPHPIGECLTSLGRIGQPSNPDSPDLGTLGPMGQSARGTLMMDKLGTAGGPTRADFSQNSACGDAGTTKLLNLTSALGTRGPDTIVSGPANNYFDGREGPDAYDMRFDGSDDTISDSGLDAAVDQVRIFEREEDIVYVRKGIDLFIHNRRKAGTIKVSNWFNGETFPIEEIVFYEGVKRHRLAPAEVAAKLVAAAPVPNPQFEEPLPPNTIAIRNTNPAPIQGIPFIDGGAGVDTVTINGGPRTTFDEATGLVCDGNKCRQLRNVERLQINRGR